MDEKLESAHRRLVIEGDMSSDLVSAIVEMVKAASVGGKRVEICVGLWPSREVAEDRGDMRANAEPKPDDTGHLVGATWPHDRAAEISRLARHAVIEAMGTPGSRLRRAMFSAIASDADRGIGFSGPGQPL